MFLTSMLISVASLQEPTNQANGTPAWVIILILLIIILLFWWGLTRNNIPEETADDSHANDHTDEPPTPEAVNVREPEVETAVVPPDPDDLKKIEGIGPKIAAILADNDITTFSQLAGTTVEDLDRIVRQEAGITVANPTSWPEQAKLAADGDWDALEELQDKLIAGRHQ